jgi:hypothetical protein
MKKIVVLFSAWALKGAIFESSYATGQSNSREAEVQGSSLFPSQLSFGMGLGLMPRVLFGQELYFHELWSVALSAHWHCHFFPSCRWLFDVYHQQFLPLPESALPVSVRRNENRTGIEVGAESRRWLPFGLSFGISEIAREYRTTLNEGVVIQSSDLAWRDTQMKPTLRVWTGISEMSDVIDMRFSLLHTFAENSDAAKDIYSMEMRFLY